MNKSDVKIGGVYEAKVSDKLTKVRIDGENRRGGWNVTNLATNKKVRIKSARRLQAAVTSATKAQAKEATKAAGAKDEKIEAPGKATAKKTRSAKAGGAKPKRRSALDAAAEVLGKTGKPMRCRELIAGMAEQGLWSSPNGKTPHATLYAALLREIRDKGAGSRFRKVERGQFAIKTEAKT